jgi:hypothetical protein
VSGGRFARRSPAAAAAGRALGDPRAPPDRRWIAQLTGASDEAIESTLAELRELVPCEQEIRAAHRVAGRSFFAQIRAPFELYALVRLARPAHVVEVGVSSGVSSAHFLLGLRKNRHGTLHSIDWPLFQRGSALGRGESAVAVPPGQSSGWAVPTRLRPGWDLRLGRSEQRLPALVRALPSVDLFLHDDLHTPAHLAFELRTIAPKLRPGSIVLADNTAWTGAAFPRFARRIGATWHRRRRSDLVGLRVPAPAAGRRGSPHRTSG